MQTHESNTAALPYLYGPGRSDALTDAVSKRKAEDHPPVEQKKRKLRSPSPPASYTESLAPCAGLPPAVWQHVFLYCSLADLGRLVQVNRAFLSYLTRVSNASSSAPASARPRLVNSESVWASARNALSIKPPKPLPGFSELQMWQLAWSKTCQFCNKVNSFTPGEKIWQKGPGDTGVRIIWPFAVRACGPCLLQHSQTDASLLFSSASALRPALPFALITNDRNYVTAYTLRNALTPADVEIGRYYYQKHVEAINQEFNDALGLGTAAAEEWFKGLERRGNERMKLAESWERWEVKQQWWEEHHGEKRPVSTASSMTATAISYRDPSKSPNRPLLSPVIHAPVPAAPSKFAQARPPTVPPQGFTPHPVSTGSTAPSGRNLHDAIEAKANRKADIEQRCQQMSPPIAPNVLRHMESFRAAIQIPQPMTDYAWSQLQPRLLAQLEAAEQAEAGHLSRVASVPAKPGDRRHQDGNTREVKEAMDRDWEESQKATRDRLNFIAEDFIKQFWDHGNAVTFENSPKFAVDLLTHVRRIFYTTRAGEENALLSEPERTSTNPLDYKPSLVLDDMKWVYDNKLRPLIEQFRKEVFLCSVSDCDRNTRFYGFEGIVQHYGARHTNSFSVGNSGVAWREAEWPDDPPFHIDPISVKNAQHSSTISAGINGYYSGLSRAGTTTPHMPVHLPHQSPGPIQYGSQYNGPFPPPQATSSTMPSFPYTQLHAPSTENYAYSALGAGGYVSQAGHNSYMQSPAMMNPLVAPSPLVPSPAQGVTDIVSSSSEDVTSSTSSYDKQVSTIIQNAQDIWKQTSGIKDLPNSLRIYVLLHRVISKFHVDFNHEPKLTHMIDAFDNHEVPKALKHAPGLSCKACQVESSQQHYPGTSSAKPEERRTYTVMNLLLHFRTHHWPLTQPGPTQGQHAQPMDWKEDMIELPSERFIAGLIHAPGMDNEKLLVIALVFPRLFPTPLPKIGTTDSYGLASPTSSGPKDSKGPNDMIRIPSDAREHSGPSPSAIQADLPTPRKGVDDESDSQRLALTTHGAQPSNSSYHKQPQRDTPPAERWRYYPEHRYYVSRDQLDEGYTLPREYVEFRTSPRIAPAGPIYDGYPGRRNEFQDQEIEYGPPQESLIYARPPDAGQAEEPGSYSRQIRYREGNPEHSEYHYVREHRSREVSPYRGQSAADRFLDELVPGQASAEEHNQSSLPPQPGVKLSSPLQAIDDTSRPTPPPQNVPSPSDLEDRHRSLAAPPPKAPSTVSNGSRYEEPRSDGRHIPFLETGRPRRAPPPRRRDRAFEPRPPSRFFRYMSIARDDPYGRGSSMSRSQSRRYDEQRRRLDQQETSRSRTDHDYRSVYSRGTSVDHHSPEDDYYQHSPLPPRDYVSIQDRLHPYSPPLYREQQPVYVDEYGQQVHEYKIIRVRGDSRPPHNSYHQPPRYQPGGYQYVPVTYERSLPKREYILYEERERPLPTHAASDADNEIYEPPPPEIKIENPSVSGPEAS